MAYFDTSDYKRSHSKAPRGEGCWAFAPNTTGEYMFSTSMSYTEAKQWAREQAPDATMFDVGP
jgi:hypothetical protein